jgi:hypothetical protein
MIVDQQVASGSISTLLQLLNEGGQLLWVQVIHYKFMVDCSLDGMAHLLESIPQLVLQPGEPSLKQSGVHQQGREQGFSDLCLRSWK